MKIDKQALFIKSALRYETAIKQFDSVGTKDCVFQMDRIACEIIRENGSELCGLLKHEVSIVRLMAACYMLLVDPDLAVETLSELGEGGDYCFEASQAIERWKEGVWTYESLQRGLECKCEDERTLDEPIDVMKLAKEINAKIPFSEIDDLTEMEVRLGVVNVFFQNIIGINEGYASFCPNDNPPSEDECLAWLWFVRPAMATQISQKLNDADFCVAIRNC